MSDRIGLAVAAVILAVIMLFSWFGKIIGGKFIYDPVPGEPITDGVVTCAGSSAQTENAAEALNAVYRLFGGFNGQKSLCYLFGNEATYFEWVAEKILWTGDSQYIGELKNKMISYPQTDNGYLWSWGTSTYWPTGNGDIHYDGLFRYINAVADIISWQGDLSLLSAVDNDTVGTDTALDASKGRTVYEKCRLVMDYALNVLHGSDGAIRLTEASVYLADGKTRFDAGANGKYVWDNTGLNGSAPSNYWDNLLFGNLDAYETMLFYKALGSMSVIENALGNKAEAEKYASLAEKVHTVFDELFWNPETGRYGACVDTNGVLRDYGLTFLNTEALAAGLGDREKAESIFSWLDGERIVPGDTVTGSDIMDYSVFLGRLFKKGVPEKKLPFVCCTNTVPVEQSKDENGYWWFDLENSIKVGQGENAEFGRHLENGGYIFYTLYYELTARAKYFGTQSVLERLADVDAVYRFNGLDSDVADWAEGLIGEFPESGLVGSVLPGAILGITCTPDSVTLAPRLPADAGTLTVKNVCLHGCGCTLTAGCEDTLTLSCEKGLTFDFVYRPAHYTTFTVALYDGSDNLLSRRTVSLSDGQLAVFAAGENAARVEILPVK